MIPNQTLDEVLSHVTEPKVEGSELVWMFRCYDCQACWIDPNTGDTRPHWLNLEEIPGTQFKGAPR